MLNDLIIASIRGIIFAIIYRHICYGIKNQCVGGCGKDNEISTTVGRTEEKHIKKDTKKDTRRRRRGENEEAEKREKKTERCKKKTKKKKQKTEGKAERGRHRQNWRRWSDLIQ